VLTMHPTLLIGPADRDAARFPREEFAARIAALWEVCEPDVAGAVVFGSARHHAELTWLTHFTPRLAPLMGRKSARELAAIQETCGTLDAALGAIGTAWRSGATVTDAALAAEQAANHRGAQDVRTLFSLDGGHTLVPFTVPHIHRIDPLQVYVAMRQHGYWVDGFRLFCNSPNAALAVAGAALLACTLPPPIGRSRGELAASLAAACASGGRCVHPVVAGEFVKPVGLALEVAPTENPDGDMLVPNSVHSARAGIIVGSEAAIVSSTLFL
jgi:hypothetical protein